jgi:hypothetical protein
MKNIIVDSKTGEIKVVEMTHEELAKIHRINQELQNS